MDNEKILEWQSYYRKITERDEDWFWALGVIAIFSGIISLLFGNILLAIIIGLTAFILFSHEKRPIDNTLSVKINKRGVQLNNELFTYEKISSFWVDEDDDKEDGEEKEPRLILHYKRLFVPNVIIPIIGPSPKKVRQMMLKYGEEEKHIQSFTEIALDILGF